MRSGVFGPSEIADANGGDLLAPADPARRESLHIGIIRAQAAVEAHQFKSSIRRSKTGLRVVGIVLADRDRGREWRCPSDTVGIPRGESCDTSIIRAQAARWRCGSPS